MKRSRSDAHITMEALPMDATLMRLVMCRLDLHDLGRLWRCSKFFSTFSMDEDLCMTYVGQHTDIPWHDYFYRIYGWSRSRKDMLGFLHQREYSSASRSFAMWYYHANPTHISARMLLAWYGMTERLVKSVNIPAEKFYKSIVCQTAVAAGHGDTLRALLDAGQGRFQNSARRLALVAIRHHTQWCLPIILNHHDISGTVFNDDIIKWAVMHKNRAVLDMAQHLLAGNGRHEKGYQMLPSDIPPSDGCAACILFNQICGDCAVTPEVVWLAERQWVDLQQLAQYVTIR